jgi:hypothetical protein
MDNTTGMRQRRHVRSGSQEIVAKLADRTQNRTKTSNDTEIPLYKYMPKRTDELRNLLLTTTTSCAPEKENNVPTTEMGKRAQSLDLRPVDNATNEPPRARSLSDSQENLPAVVKFTNSALVAYNTEMPPKRVATLKHKRHSPRATTTTTVAYEKTEYRASSKPQDPLEKYKIPSQEFMLSISNPDKMFALVQTCTKTQKQEQSFWQDFRAYHTKKEL